jgi:glucose/arabinose dehydrogenase
MNQDGTGREVYATGVRNSVGMDFNPKDKTLWFTDNQTDGTADKTEVFATGWLDDDTGTYRGRPVDVAVAKDGSLFVSDDYAGAIYRISYTAP